MIMKSEINDRICKNVRALCKLHEVKIGDIEAGMDRNPGFLSRKPKLSVDEMVYLAKQLGVSIQDLMEKDFATALTIQTHEDIIYEAVANMRDDTKISKDEMMKLLIRICNGCYNVDVGGEF